MIEPAKEIDSLVEFTKDEEFFSLYRKLMVIASSHTPSGLPDFVKKCIMDLTLHFRNDFDFRRRIDDVNALYVQKRKKNKKIDQKRKNDDRDCSEA